MDNNRSQGEVRGTISAEKTERFLVVRRAAGPWTQVPVYINKRHPADPVTLQYTLTVNLSHSFQAL